MKLQSPNGYMILGNYLRYLREISVTRPLNGKIYFLSTYDSVLRYLNELNFTVSLSWIDNQTTPLIDECKKLVDDAEQDESVRPNKELATRLVKKMIEFESVVMAEAATRKIALPTPRRYDLEKLTENPEKLFPAGSYSKLPLLAQADILSGCKAIAFDLPTASAFHLLRAVEDCLNCLHCAYLPRTERAKKAWGGLLKDLREKPRKPKPDDLLLTHLDHLRDKFRNPTSHPDKSYEIDEAQDLLNLCIDAISRCSKDEKFTNAIKSGKYE